MDCLGQRFNFLLLRDEIRSQWLFIALKERNLKIRPGTSVASKQWWRKEFSFSKSLHRLKSYGPIRFSLSLEIFPSVEKFVSCWRTKSCFIKPAIAEPFGVKTTIAHNFWTSEGIFNISSALISILQGLQPCLVQTFISLLFRDEKRSKLLKKWQNLAILITL